MLSTPDDIYSLVVDSVLDTRAQHSAADDAHHEVEQRAVYVRLAVQLFALTAVLLPDSVSYFLVDRGAPGSLTSVKVTGFIWECEGPVVALLWFSNKRVVEAISHLCSCCGGDAARDTPLMAGVAGGSSHHATELGRSRGASRARHASAHSRADDSYSHSHPRLDSHPDTAEAAHEASAVAAASKASAISAATGVDADAAHVGVTVAAVE